MCVTLHFIHMGVYMYAKYVQIPTRQKRASDCPDLELQAVVSSTPGRWEWRSGVSQEQYKFLMAKLSLQFSGFPLFKKK